MSLPARKLQEKAENGDIRELSEQSQLHVANRLLAIRGYKGAREWFKQQYGEEYDEEMVAKKLRCIVAKYGDFDSEADRGSNTD